MSKNNYKKCKKINVDWVIDVPEDEKVWVYIRFYDARLESMPFGLPRTVWFFTMIPKKFLKPEQHHLHAEESLKEMIRNIFHQQYRDKMIQRYRPPWNQIVTPPFIVPIIRKFKIKYFRNHGTHINFDMEYVVKYNPYFPEVCVPLEATIFFPRELT